MKRFLYLFQVEQDLPPALAPAAAADSDVLFVSYRARSSDPRSIFYPHSSWTQGRNRLLKEALGGPYHYFVFGDGDVRLELTRRGAAVAGRRRDPWRVFEEFLLEYEPAIGSPSYFWHLSGKHDDRADVQTLRFFDPVLNAFHHEALVPLLPYYDLLDNESEQYSGSVVSAIAAGLYPGHVLQTNRVRVVNPVSHRGDTERLMTKAETLYLESLRDDGQAQGFLRQLEWASSPHPGMGEPRAKTAWYHLSDDDLSHRYRLDHTLWARKRALLDLPKADAFFSDAADTARAQDWRRGHDRGPAARPSLLKRLSMVSRPLRLRLGLVRSARPVVAIRGWLRLRHRLRVLATRVRRRARQPNDASRWRQWQAGRTQPFELLASEHESLLGMLGFVLDQLADPQVVFIHVGTGRGEVLGMLENGTLLKKPVLSIGVDPIQTRGFTWYSGFVLGPAGQGAFTLSAIVSQYGLAGRVLHYVRIDSDEDGVSVFHSLGEYARQCLFLTVRMPWPQAAFLAEGFHVLNASRTSPQEADVTFVNVNLLRSLLPGFL